MKYLHLGDGEDGAKRLNETNKGSWSMADINTVTQRMGGQYEEYLYILA